MLGRCSPFFGRLSPSRLRQRTSSARQFTSASRIPRSALPATAHAVSSAPRVVIRRETVRASGISWMEGSSVLEDCRAAETALQTVSSVSVPVPPSHARGSSSVQSKGTSVLLGAVQHFAARADEIGAGEAFRLLLLFSTPLLHPARWADLRSFLLQRAEESVARFSMLQVAEILCRARQAGCLDQYFIATFADHASSNISLIPPCAMTQMVWAVGTCGSLDEFWMFMMAKEIQKDATVFSPCQLTLIAKVYSDAALEDPDFYASLVEAARKEFDSFATPQMCDFVSALANVRVRDVEFLCRAFTRIETDLRTVMRRGGGLERPSEGKEGFVPVAPSSALTAEASLSSSSSSSSSSSASSSSSSSSSSSLPSSDMCKAPAVEQVLKSAIAAFHLDFGQCPVPFHWKFVGRVLGERASRRRAGGFSLQTTVKGGGSGSTSEEREMLMDLSAPLSFVGLPDPFCYWEFLPFWLSELEEHLDCPRTRVSLKMRMLRRLRLFRDSFDAGLLSEALLPPGILSLAREALKKRGEATHRASRDYQPESSAFHLEVASSLSALRVSHEKEHMVPPSFILDIALLPGATAHLPPLPPEEQEEHPSAAPACLGQRDQETGDCLGSAGAVALSLCQ
uniref:RAP domain-containing protein n=1 Tax=Chromera velia CCMP2878 TaxID=1169474 RepID=A0A0G4FUF9_9ALVE|eukprot:Cvel_18839.t1-p1 / transcript=Cvel_18839.t1 / gene=Cvel_18839 / organism=Chromera_velia_CCMP2878 / gene_product=hypothetical protein / transcript_product=hypothetical protein / location=Cvel_scaffold1583:33450-36564(+) / protein_length=625 / sequence_SO=supercontig / SO=protein_coding / is_pseudo=false